MKGNMARVPYFRFGFCGEVEKRTKRVVMLGGKRGEGKGGRERGGGGSGRQ